MILENSDQLPHPARRIISLVPSQTSLLNYLGLENETIGITKFCIHPTQWIKDKEIIGGTKNLRFETIKKLNPDLIIANKEENVKEQIEVLAKDYNVWVTDVNTIYEALQMIADIGILTGKEEASGKLINEIKHLQTELLKIPLPPLQKNVAYFIWKDPWMVAASGTYINDLIELAGFHNYFSEQERYPTIKLEELKKEKIDIIFLSSEPYPFKEKHKEELQLVFPTSIISLVDGEMFSWYGDFLLKSLPYLKALNEKLNR